MIDEHTLDETQSSHSIGVVENPLYAEDEGFEPRFAALSAKEKEAEVSIVLALSPQGVPVYNNIIVNIACLKAEAGSTERQGTA